MKCNQCGTEFYGKGQLCPDCQPSVRVLSPEEREDFNGITLAGGESRNDEYHDYSENGRRVYVKQIRLMPGSVIGRIILSLVVIGLVVVALPLVAFVLAAGFLGWLLKTLIRR